MRLNLVSSLDSPRPQDCAQPPHLAQIHFTGSPSTHRPKKRMKEEKSLSSTASSAPHTNRPSVSAVRQLRERINDFRSAASRSAHRLAWWAIMSTNSDETLLGPCFFLVFFSSSHDAVPLGGPHCPRLRWPLLGRTDEPGEAHSARPQAQDALLLHHSAPVPKCPVLASTFYDCRKDPSITTIFLRPNLSECREAGRLVGWLG